MREALIVDAVRSPIGKRNGSLSKIRADDLAGQVLSRLVARHELDPAEIEDVQMGCVSQVGEQGWNIGRMAPLVAGWPESVCGTTVDRQCGSSMQCNFNAAAAVSSGQLDVVVSAGVESMSRVPMGSSGGDVSEKLTERWEIVPQGMSAELIAERWGFSREELDAFSYESHRRARRRARRRRRGARLADGEGPRRRGGRRLRGARRARAEGRAGVVASLLRRGCERPRTAGAELKGVPGDRRLYAVVHA